MVALRGEQLLVVQWGLPLLLLEESERLPRDADDVLDGLLDLARVAFGILQLLLLVHQVLVSELVKEHDIG